MRAKACGLFILAAIVFGVAAPARAADTPIELGTSLAGLSVGFGDNDFRTFGVPTSGFGILSPAVYASIFATPKLSIEPQLGLIIVSSGHDTNDVLNLAGQVNYFTNGTEASSPYIFGSLGIVHVSSGDTTPKTISGGVGYRARMGGRLVFRLDGRLQHFTDNGGTALIFTLSLGGIFGGR